MSYEMKEVRDEGMDVTSNKFKKRKIQPSTWRGTYVGMVRGIVCLEDTKSQIRASDY